MAKKKGFFINGIPISRWWKLTIMMTIFVILMLNQLLPVFIESIDYPGRWLVSIVLIILFVIISIGSFMTESIVIGLALFILMSNTWDLNVNDISDLRKQLLLGSVGVLLFSLLVGKISIFHLIKILRGQLGVSK